MANVKSLWQEFKEFAVKGNAIDLAVGVVIGAAFGGVVKSLVEDVIMPPLGVLTGGVDFRDKLVQLRPAISGPDGKEIHPAVDWRYGAFFNNIINFLIVAAAIFLVIKLLSMLHQTKAADPPPTLDQQLLTEIRDLLKKQNPGT
jgi:large conductance mechanosensitive channel